MVRCQPRVHVLSYLVTLDSMTVEDASRLTTSGWRKKAVPYHDLHHVLTGYPFSPAGEFEMAAWEFRSW